MTESMFDELCNARPLDVHTWSDYPEVNIFVNHIYSRLDGIGGNVRINKKNLKVVLLDLFVAWSADPTLKIMFSRDNNAYVAKSRYNEINIGKKVIQVVDALIDVGLIHQKTGFNDRISGTAFQSRLWASDELVEHFKAAKFHQFNLNRHEDSEVIVLRDEDKFDVEDYILPLNLHSTESLLHDYNELLSNTHVDIEVLDKPVITIGSGKKKMTLQVNQKDKFVRRIFNQNQWDKGGRFYGGWWQRCPKAYRRRIVFDKIMTAEIDYSGIHIVILYAQQDIDYWNDIGVDPYALDILADVQFDPAIDLRTAAKLLLLTAINADTESATFQAFRKQADAGSPEKRLTNVQLSALLDALREKHVAIAHRFASGAGIDLMFVDSQITERLIRKFTYHYKCPILTVHDSYIVPFGWDYILKKEMVTAFEEVTGIRNAAVEHTTDYYNIVDQESAVGEPKPEYYDDRPPTTRHIDEYELFREFKNKPEREHWVPDWTAIY